MAAQPPPIIANANGRNAVDLYAQMNPMDPPVLRAARAHNRAAIARDLVGPGLVTENEFGAAVVYSHETSAVAAAAAAAAGAAVLPGVLGAPAWAANLINTVNNINNTVNNINNTLANHTATLANHTAILANHTATLANLTARQSNSTTVDMTDQLVALTNAGGNIPANFPATVGALCTLNGPTLQVLLTHYGLNVPHSVEERRRRFQQFIGIRP